MNDRQIEVLQEWMERALEQQWQLEARVVAAELTLTAFMQTHPDPAQLLEELEAIDQALLKSDPEKIEVTDRVQDHLGRTIEVLEGIVQDRESAG